GVEIAYLGQLLLAVGLVDQTERELNQIPADSPAAPLAAAVRGLISAVRLDENAPASPQTASEWLADSYWPQSKARLQDALNAARKAVEKSPRFGYGWE